MFRYAVALFAAACLAAPATAQVQRNFPQNALRGSMVFAVAPEVLLNGRSVLLAPGARIRDTSNMVVVPSSLYGGRFLVHYTVDTSSLVKDVWILRPDEAANKPWPTTPDEAQAWSFDPIAQTWVKP
jgi:hypothetical protein